MDDAPRARLLKTVSIVGFLVLMGAGCEKQLQAPSAVQTPSPTTSVKTCYTGRSIVVDGLSVSEEIDCAVFQALDQNPLIIQKQQEGWIIRGVQMATTTKGDVLYFKMLSWEGMEKYSQTEKPFVVYTDDRLAPNLIGFWLRTEKDPIFSPLIGVTSQGDIGEIGEMTLVPDPNRYGVVVHTKAGGGDGPFSFISTFDFNPETRKLIKR